MGEIATGLTDLASQSIPIPTPGVTDPSEIVTNTSTFRPLQTFKELLGDPSFIIPVEANFIISLNFTANLLNLINQINNSSFLGALEPVSYNVGNTQKEISNILSKYKTLGLMYASNITIPGEGVDTTKIKVSDTDNAGIFLPLPTLRNRRPQTTFSMDVLETNRSFLDAYIRPWIIVSSLYGLYTRSRSSSQNIKLDSLNIIQYDKSRNIRKNINFINVLPVSINSSTLTYGNTAAASTKVISTSWLFESYSITSY